MVFNMKETPHMISPKDLLYIEDMMNWNLIMNKKIKEYLECVDSAEVKELLNTAKKMHKKHFKELLTILE